jgi:hypothetical protein
MMMRGFFDESNKNANDIHFLLTGWTATVEEWEQFTEAWSQCLAAVPSIKRFKWSEANGLNEEFARFSRKAADEKKLALANVIATHPLRGYIVSAPHAMLAGKPKELKKLMASRIFDWAFMALIPTVINDRLERGELIGKIDFIFDGCTELRACIESYERERVKWPPSMQQIAGEVIPGDDHELAGLQAADFLAGEASLHFKTRQPSSFFKAMLNQIPIVQTEVFPNLIQKTQEMTAYARGVFERQAVVQEVYKIHKRTGGDPRKMTQSDFDTFSRAMDTILKADPAAVKAAMEAEKRAREEAQKATGKRGRGRPPKHSSASGPASS